MKKITLLLPCLFLLACSNQSSETNSSGFINNSGEIPSINLNDAEDYNPNKEENGDQFNFDGNYTAPELVIDGYKNDSQWQNSSPKVIFGAQNNASMIMYRGESALFCFFEVNDIDIQTVGNNNGDDVTKGDSVEVYFDFKNDGSNKPQSDDIQINIGAHGKTRIFVGSNGQWGSWNGLLDYSIVLDGTLNNDTDNDKGYTVELMIPYAQVGISKNSTFAFSVGHVERGKDSTNETLPYTWGGLTYEGSFVDPQSPATYVVYQGNNFYSRDNVPMNQINITGTIIDQQNNKVENAKVKINDQETLTTKDGKYTLTNVDPNNNTIIEISKDGFKTYTKELTSTLLKSTKTGSLNLDYVLINNSLQIKKTISGIVKNPSEGIIQDCLIEIDNQKILTNNEGKFSIEVVLDNDLILTASKENYKTSSTTLSLIDIVSKNSLDLGTIELYSPSSSFTFGGSRGITKITSEVYRGFEGINFTFKSNKAISNGDHVELFIDTNSSFHGRDDSDYRIDFKSDSSFSIVNFGNGSNNIPSTSKIINNAYLKGTTYYMDVFIPYTFLSISPTDIIGISCGVWSEANKDWDGWSYAGAGFEDYVAPEYTDQYCRISLDNGLYRAINNQIKATKIYGRIVDSNNNPVSIALINSKQVNEDGSFAIWAINGSDFELIITANGYISKTIKILGTDLNGNALKKTITLSKGECLIKGTCNVNGAKVYYQENPNIFTYVENNTYSLAIPTSSNAHIVFEANGYKTLTKAIGKASLVNPTYTYNCIMEAN